MTVAAAAAAAAVISVGIGDAAAVVALVAVAEICCLFLDAVTVQSPQGLCCICASLPGRVGTSQARSTATVRKMLTMNK